MRVLVALALCCSGAESARASDEPPSTTAAALASKLAAGEPVSIADTRVTGDVTLDSGDLTTRDVTFEDAVEVLLGGDSKFRFVDTTFAEPVTLHGGEALGACRECSLTGENVTFQDRVSLRPKSGVIELVDSAFLRPVEFVDTFTRLACRNCGFRAPATFTGITVEGLDLRDTVFDQPADFSDARITRPRLSCFRGKPIYITWEDFGEAWMKTELDEARAVNPDTPYEQLKAAVLCWRDNFESIGFARDATTASHAAAKITREHLENPPSPAWFFAWMPEGVDGWGTRPWQPFLVSAIVVVGFWLYFWAANPFQSSPGFRDNTPLAAFAFFFSLETFVPIFKVTGVKDWGWSTTGAGRWFEVTEAAVGAVLSAVAAYAFAAQVF